MGRPNIADRDAFLRRIEGMVDSRQFSNFGPLSLEFERRVADVSGVAHGVAVCNATVGLELAVAALGMQGEVIVPSFTFVATTHALWRQNIRPVFCDIDPETHCLDPERVEAAITPRTTGILAVPLWGNYAREADLGRIATAHGLKLVLDSAHAFGCGRPQGSPRPACHAEVFSFHATKCIQAIEGGVIATDDPALANKLRLMVNFGFAGEDTVLYLGTNGKMSEASAAMGLSSLEARNRIFEHNRLNFVAYADGLAKVAGVALKATNQSQVHNWQYIVTEVDPAVAGLTRNEIVAALRLENVLARRYFHPGCHRMEPYASLFPDAGRHLPVTEAVSERVMVLPTGLSVSPRDVRRLTDQIAAICARAPEVRTALRTSDDLRIPDFLR